MVDFIIKNRFKAISIISLEKGDDIIKMVATFKD